MDNNSSLNNIYNWGKIYSNPYERWKDLYPQHFSNEWNRECITCNKYIELNDRSFSRKCINCFEEYNKNKAKYRSKAYNLLKRKNIDTVCEVTGCTKRQLIYYLETLFDNNMNWENQSTYWEIDHRIPLAWFDLDKEEEVKIACNYKNLQPMEKQQNHDKNCQYPTNKLFSYVTHSEDTS